MRIQGFGLIESLISLVILSSVLFGLLHMQVLALRFQHEAENEIKATNILYNTKLAQLYHSESLKLCLEQAQALPRGQCILGLNPSISWASPGLSTQELHLS